MKERFKGIDILRIVAMIFIVELHFLGHGGVLKAVSKGTLKYSVAYLYEIISYCGVAIFGIITGFVSYSKTTHNVNRIGKFLGLWLEVVFYNLLLTTSILLIINRSINVRMIIECFFPIARQTYWYFTTYFILFLIIPALNKIIAGNTAVQNTAFLLFEFLMLYYSHTITGFFAITMLTFCYLLGAMIRKYNIHHLIRKSVLFIGYFVLVLITFLWTTMI